MGQTIAEKIFSNHVGAACKTGDFVVCTPDLLMTHDANRPLTVDMLQKLGAQPVFDPARTVVVIDHHTPAPAETNANIHKRLRNWARENQTVLYESRGICHQLLPENGHVAPGDLVTGSDSHTCTYGALNALASGVGTTDLVVALTQGKLWFKVPASIRIELSGSLPPGVFAKDLILHLLGRYGANGAVYKCLEFCGEGVSTLSVSSRLTVCNMAVEMGAKAGIMPCDDRLLDWLKGRGGRGPQPVAPDESAIYQDSWQIDLAGLSPMVARPHRVDDVVPVSQLDGVPVQQANLAGCTNGRLEDLKAAAHILKGKKIHQGVRLLVVPASQQVLLDAMAEGVMQTLLEAGAVLANPSCKGCSGGPRFGVPADGDNVISSANRNFQGRLGNPAANIYLASPAMVAAAALTGRIVDCREFF